MFKPIHLLALSLLFLSYNSFSLETANGRLSGVSNAGYVTGGYSDGVLLNPSLGADNNETDDFALVINLGAKLSDPGEMLDTAEELSNLLNKYNGQSRQLETKDAELILARLYQLTGKQGHVNAGASLLLAIPNRLLSIAAFVRAEASVGIHPDIDLQDTEIVENAVGDFFDSDQLHSSISGRGLLTTEIGLALSKRFAVDAHSHLLVGITPKRVDIYTMVYAASAANYDENDLDADEYRRDHQFYNMDMGITYVRGPMRYGFSVSNVQNQTLETVNPQHHVNIKPRATAAWGYQNTRLSAEIAVDANAVEDFAYQRKTQIVRAGIEVNATSWLQLRAGIKYDLQDIQPNTYSIGFGLSPFDVVNIDLAALKGSDDTYGGALQLGLRF